MDDDGSVIARRLAFLERELDRMGDAADDAEHELRLNPTDAAARRQLQAIYALAGKTWSQIL
jgi:protein involved in temperature-dependent protein secretion